MGIVAALPVMPAAAAAVMVAVVCPAAEEPVRDWVRCRPGPPPLTPAAAAAAVGARALPDRVSCPGRTELGPCCAAASRAIAAAARARASGLAAPTIRPPDARAEARRDAATLLAACVPVCVGAAAISMAERRGTPEGSGGLPYAAE